MSSHAFSSIGLETLPLQEFYLNDLHILAHLVCRSSFLTIFGLRVSSQPSNKSPNSKNYYRTSNRKCQDIFLVKPFSKLKLPR